jgi:hypothetical protein
VSDQGSVEDAKARARAAKAREIDAHLRAIKMHNECGDLVRPFPSNPQVTEGSRTCRTCSRAAAASSSRARGSRGTDSSKPAETGSRGGPRGRSGASPTVSSAALCRSCPTHPTPWTMGPRLDTQRLRCRNRLRHTKAPESARRAFRLSNVASRLAGQCANTACPVRHRIRSAGSLDQQRRRT